MYLLSHLFIRIYMRYNINIKYRTSELTKGLMAKKYLDFTWDEIPKYKNSDPLEIELMIGDRVIYSDPKNEKSIYNGMTAIITKITPEISLAQKRNLLVNRYLNRFMFNDEEEKKEKKEKKGGGNKALYDINFLLDDIEEEEIDYLNIEGKTKTIKKGLKNLEREYLLGYTTKSLILDIDTSITDKSIIKDKISRFLKYVFLHRGLQIIPKYIDKNKYKFENMEEWRRDNSFFYSQREDIKVGKNVIRDIDKKAKKRKFKKNKDLYLIKDLTLDDLKIHENKKNSKNDYNKRDIIKSFYTGGRLKNDDALLIKTKNYLTKIYGESVKRKKGLFSELLKKEDIFGLDDSYGQDLNKEAKKFINNILMDYIFNYVREKTGVKMHKEGDTIYNHIKGNIGYSFLKLPLLRQLFIIKKILEESELLDYKNSNIITKKIRRIDLEKSINEIFEKVYFNKSIIEVDVNMKFYLRKEGSFGSKISLGSTCNKRRDVMGRDFNTMIKNLSLAWNEGRTELPFHGGKMRKTKKKRRRNKKTRRKNKKTRIKKKRKKSIKRKKRTKSKY